MELRRMELRQKILKIGLLIGELVRVRLILLLASAADSEVRAYLSG